MPRVLCVDDNDDTRENIIEIISEWDECPYGKCEVIGENNFESAINRLKNERFDFITLDLHGATDPDPLKENEGQEEQEGKRILNALREIRFIPVVFYTGYADKIESLKSGVVKVVKKGEDDLNKVRCAIDELYKTGLSKLISYIEEENRKYIWDTIDKSWVDIEKEISSDDFAYLLARRLGARLNRESVKELLHHDVDKVHPIEMYIYPPHTEKIKTGCIIKDDESSYWIVATPACDFVQSKVESVLLIGTKVLDKTQEYIDWESNKWFGNGEAPSRDASKTYNKLSAILANRAGDRFRFLPGTFFVENIVADFQDIKKIPLSSLDDFCIVCRVDSPFREELLSQLSRYYGRMGVPDLDIKKLINSL
ncbi:response regulator [Pectobacterium punjabense]|uniref:response regulator n=1 Tax=Pectobacterium punjabense TaxID=2108399 RepID=UPI0024071BFD|nr:response regulator [Pectobacterium punjabense]MDG0796043.1 response regulator [Pectobacterium punjabense]